MKLLVLSDSHWELNHMVAAVHREKPQALIHLGDHADDARRLQREFPQLPLCVVRGNCDRFSSDPEEALIQWEGVRIFAVHGHKYGVKDSLLRLRYAGLEKEARVVLFGHTHAPCCVEEDGRWMMNPGACGGRRPSYGIVEIENGSVSCSTEELYREEL